MTTPTQPSAAAMAAADAFEHDYTPGRKEKQRVLDRARIIDAKYAPLVEALRKLVDVYICNEGTKHEFICCITPKHASDMTKKERGESAVWSAWNNARNALAAATGTEAP